MSTTTTYIGAIDQGTSSTRFIIFDNTLQPIISHQIPLPLIYPSSSYVEVSPQLLLETVYECMHTVHTQRPDITLSAIGITNQRETTIVWDRVSGEPLYNGIVWLDQRSAGVCDEIARAHNNNKDVFRPICGLPLSSYFSATKLKWLLDNVPAVRAAADAGTALFGTVDSWLIWNLTARQVHTTDVTNASRTMLMDLRTCAWSDEMCAQFGVPKSMLAVKITSNAAHFGVVSAPNVAYQGVPLSGCLGDQQAAMVGQQCFERGCVKNTYGTGCFMLMNTGPEIVQSTKGLLTTVCYQLGDQVPVHYALEGSVAVAGAAIKWMVEQLGMFANAAQVSTEAATVDSAQGMYFVPAFSGLFAPYWRSDARGVFCGLSFVHTRAHFARAVLEAVCYSSADIMRVMQEETKCSLAALKVDGGMTESTPMLQFQADVLDIQVARPACLETTAMGAAYAAAIGAGLGNCVQLADNATTFAPQMTKQRRDEALAGWHKAISKAMDSVV